MELENEIIAVLESGEDVELSDVDQKICDLASSGCKNEKEACELAQAASLRLRLSDQDEPEGGPPSEIWLEWVIISLAKFLKKTSS